MNNPLRIYPLRIFIKFIKLIRLVEAVRKCQAFYHLPQTRAKISSRGSSNNKRAKSLKAWVVLGICTLELSEYRVRWDVREFLSHCSRYSWQPARHMADKRAARRAWFPGQRAELMQLEDSTLMMPPIGLFVPSLTAIMLVILLL